MKKKKLIKIDSPNFYSHNGGCTLRPCITCPKWINNPFYITFTFTFLWSNQKKMKTLNQFTSKRVVRRTKNIFKGIWYVGTNVPYLSKLQMFSFLTFVTYPCNSNALLENNQFEWILSVWLAFPKYGFELLNILDFFYVMSLSSVWLCRPATYEKVLHLYALFVKIKIKLLQSKNVISPIRIYDCNLS